jgi:hypothetical protein
LWPLEAWVAALHAPFIDDFTGFDRPGNCGLSSSRPRSDPLRRDHDRQVLHQLAGHLPGDAAAANNDPGSQYGDRHTGPEQVLHFRRLRKWAYKAAAPLRPGAAEDARRLGVALRKVSMSRECTR